MDKYNNEIQGQFEIVESKEKPSLLDRWNLDAKTIGKHAGLFALTFASVLFTSQAFFYSLGQAVTFTVLLLLFLGTHEFGHFLTAMYHRVNATLPYFIPLPILSPIGTMGAVIRIKERIETTKKLFDVGIAGPLAGFVVSLATLMIGFFNLPEPAEFVSTFPGHEALKQYVATYGAFPNIPTQEMAEGGMLMLGDTLLYSFFAGFFENVPPMWEMYHYPFLFAGWLGLLFTALNLMPVGQLDGGHILYGLLGFKKHRSIARSFLGLITILGGIGVVPLIHDLLPSYTVPYLGELLSWLLWAGLLYLLLKKAFNNDQQWILAVGAVSLISSYIILTFFESSVYSGYTSWAVWALFIIYLVRVEHPPVRYTQKLDPVRTWLGWLSMLIFVLCISPNPFYFSNL